MSAIAVAFHSMAWQTHINIVHWVTVSNAGEPVLRLVFGFHNPSVNELEKAGSVVAVVFTEAPQESVCLSQVKDVK